MTRVIWGSQGERLYETGVDRGVLYPPFGHGVSWNGLVSVKENPSGGAPKPYYIDGFKYLNVATSEEFEATLEAFSSPTEFGICDGTVSISNGLFVTQQPRREFGLSYRSRLGNDVDGVDHGYKVHLVYNLLASPNNQDNATLSENVDPSIFSWGLTAVAPKLSGYRPTAHFSIDSRHTPPLLLQEIEDLLYGTGLANARLPSAMELIALFTAV